MWCILILPFRQRVIAVGQKYFSFRVIVLVCLTKDHVECDFSPGQVLEYVLTEVRSEVIITTRWAEGHLLGRCWDGRAEEDLVTRGREVNI